MIRHVEQQGSTIEERRTQQAEALFKPLALPALAAAVQAIRPQPPRPAARDVPPALRKGPESQ